MFPVSNIINISRVTTPMYTEWQVNMGGIAASPVSLWCCFLVWRHNLFYYKGFFIILVENPSGDNEYSGLFVCFPVRLMFTSFVSSWLWEPCQICSSVPKNAYENIVVLVLWRTHRESRNEDYFSEVENKQHLGWAALFLLFLLRFCILCIWGCENLLNP